MKSKHPGNYILPLAILLMFSWPAFSATHPAAGKKAPVRKTTPVPTIRTEAELIKTQVPAAKTPDSPPAKETPKKIDPAKTALENEHKKLEYIERTLQFGIHKDRKEAINAMLTLKNKETKDKAADLLIKAIREESDAEVKSRGITVAGDLKLNAAVPELISQLGHESEDVRIAAVNSLRNINDFSCKDALAAMLQKQDLTKDSNLAESLLNTLGGFKAAELGAFAQEKITDLKTTKTNRELLVLFLGKINAAGSKEFLIKILKDEDEDRTLRGYAANSLGHMDARDAAADINAVIVQIEAYPFKKKKEYYNLHMYCVAALAKLGDASAFPRLVDALKNDSAVVRLKAVKLLRDMKDKRTIDILKYKRDYDPSAGVQKAAREALADLGVESTTKETSDPAGKITLEEREENQ